MIIGIASALLIMQFHEDMDIIIWPDVFLSANLMIYLKVSIEGFLDVFDPNAAGMRMSLTCYHTHFDTSPA